MSGVESKLDEARLRRLAGRLIDMQEAERRRIGALLHDDVGQLLTALKLTLNLPRPDGSEPETGDALEEARDLTAKVLERVRELQLELRPAMLDDLGLADTLEWYVGRVARDAGLTLDMDLQGLESRLDPRLETACFRIAQEAVSNVVAHAGAHALALTVIREDRRVRLDVTDDGRGFDAETVRARSRDRYTGGLCGLEERILLLGGSLAIESATGRGTRLSATLPTELDNNTKGDSA